VKSRGGVAIVQDPREAVEPGMPRSALRSVDVDHCLPLVEIPPLLVKLTRAKARISEINKGRKRKMSEQKKPGFRDDALSFAECNGPLYETREGKLVNLTVKSGIVFPQRA
jgi:two-component system chemotaxis response regulator CheB